MEQIRSGRENSEQQRAGERSRHRQNNLKRRKREPLRETETRARMDPREGERQNSVGESGRVREKRKGRA